MGLLRVHWEKSAEKKREVRGASGRSGAPSTLKRTKEEGKGDRRRTAGN